MNDVGLGAVERAHQELLLNCAHLVEQRIAALWKGEPELQVGGTQVESLVLEREKHAAGDPAGVGRLRPDARLVPAHHQDDLVEAPLEGALLGAEELLRVRVHVALTLEKMVQAGPKAGTPAGKRPPGEAKPEVHATESAQPSASARVERRKEVRRFREVPIPQLDRL